MQFWIGSKGHQAQKWLECINNFGKYDATGRLPHGAKQEDYASTSLQGRTTSIYTRLKLKYAEIFQCLRVSSAWFVSEVIDTLYKKQFCALDVFLRKFGRSIATFRQTLTGPSTGMTFFIAGTIGPEPSHKHLE